MPITEDSQPSWELSQSWVDVAIHGADVAVHGTNVAVHGPDHNMFGQETVDGLHTAVAGWPAAAVGHVAAHPAVPGSHVCAPSCHVAAPSSPMVAASTVSSYHWHLTPPTGLGDAAATTARPTSLPTRCATGGAHVSAFGATAPPVWGLPVGCCCGRAAVQVVAPCECPGAVIPGHALSRPSWAQPCALGSDWAAGGPSGAAAMGSSPSLDGSSGGTAPPSAVMGGSWGAVLDALYGDGDGEAKGDFTNDPSSPTFGAHPSPSPSTSRCHAARGRHGDWTHPFGTPLGCLLPPGAAAISPLCKPPLTPPCHPPRSATVPPSAHTAAATLPRYPTIFPQEGGPLPVQSPSPAPLHQRPDHLPCTAPDASPGELLPPTGGGVGKSDFLIDGLGEFWLDDLEGHGAP